jgi:hypothetical protein
MGIFRGLDMGKCVRIQGLISTKVITSWLEEWDSLVAGDRPLDAIPTSSGPKTMDGVSNGTINKMMLNAAIEDLPPVLYVCVMYRWVDQWKLADVLDHTGIAKSTYYRRCDKAVEFIYYHINGMAAGVKDLLDKISGI